MLFPGVRRNTGILAPLCVAIITGIWIEKGMGLVVTGFIPSPLEAVTEYAPTGLELLVALGVYAIGFFVLTVLYKIVISVREAAQQG
jgi:molybdopterin-containing oxidoreductase family membrane subunit